MRRDLPDAGLADEAHHLGRPAPHPLEGGQQRRELVVAAHQRRREPERGEAARRSRLRQRAEQAMHDDRLALALSASSPAGSNAKRCRASAWVASDTRIVAGGAPRASSREVVFTVSPVTA